MFTTPVINVHGQSVKTTNVFKYLGIALDSTLSFNDHIEHLRKKLSKGMASVNTGSWQSTLNRVYAAMVLFTLDYCAVVWHEST